MQKSMLDYRKESTILVDIVASSPGPRFGLDCHDKNYTVQDNA